jgi:Polyketide cyclase / dehydrase and lipid transport
MRPVVVEAEVDVDRPPEQVFDHCSDPGREPEWNPRMKASQKTTGGPVGVAARYATEFVTGPPMVMECTGYQRPSAWSPVGSSSALTAGGGGVLPAAAGGSHLIMRMELEPHGLLRLAAPLPRHRMKPMLGRDLATIKSVLEGGSRRGPRASRANSGDTKMTQANGARPSTQRSALPAPGSHAALRANKAIKVIHTLAWFSIEACMV